MIVKSVACHWTFAAASPLCSAACASVPFAVNFPAPPTNENSSSTIARSASRARRTPSFR